MIELEQFFKDVWDKWGVQMNETLPPEDLEEFLSYVSLDCHVNVQEVMQHG